MSTKGLANTLLLSILLIFLSSCTNIQSHEAFINNLNSFLGKSFQEVIKQWGPPDKTYKLPNDYMVLQYTKSYPSTCYYPSIGGFYGSSPFLFGSSFGYPVCEKEECITKFVVDNKGIIKSWGVKGDACP